MLSTHDDLRLPNSSQYVPALAIGKGFYEDPFTLLFVYFRHFSFLTPRLPLSAPYSRFCVPYLLASVEVRVLRNTSLSYQGHNGVVQDNRGPLLF